jgi:hypothetical protein
MKNVGRLKLRFSRSRTILATALLGRNGIAGAPQGDKLNMTKARTGRFFMENPELLNPHTRQFAALRFSPSHIF